MLRERSAAFAALLGVIEKTITTRKNVAAARDEVPTPARGLPLAGYGSKISELATDKRQIRVKVSSIASRTR